MTDRDRAIRQLKQFCVPECGAPLAAKYTHTETKIKRFVNIKIYSAFIL